MKILKTFIVLFLLLNLTELKSDEKDDILKSKILKNIVINEDS